MSGLLGETSLSAYVRKYKDKFPDGFFMRVGIDDLGAINGNRGNKYGDFIIKKTADCLAENLNEKQQLYDAVNHNFEGFEDYFQPIVDATTFQLTGAEALMRFSMPSEEKEGGIEAGNVGIELTESGYPDSRHFQKLWNGLKEHGVQVILDDFGTGYSNLHCLEDLEPNYIKIDRSFTLKSLQNEYEHALMKQIIDMTHSLDLAICIEGIETGDELQDLRALGADYIQGYLFGKPCSESEFEEHFIHVGE